MSIEKKAVSGQSFFYNTVIISISRTKPGRPRKPTIKAFMGLRGRGRTPKTLKATIISAPNAEDSNSRVYHLCWLLNSQQQRTIKMIPAIKAVISSAYITVYFYSYYGKLMIY